MQLLRSATGVIRAGSVSDRWTVGAAATHRLGNGQNRFQDRLPPRHGECVGKSEIGRTSSWPVWQPVLGWPDL